MENFLSFIFTIIFACDKSEPMPRTAKNFIAMMLLSILGLLPLYGIARMVEFQRYIEGIAIILLSFLLILIWYFIFYKFKKKK